MGKFYRLMAGKHTQKEPLYKDGKPVVHPETGEPVRVLRTYTRDDGAFESEHDLVALFNRPGAIKFERVETHVPVQVHTPQAAPPPATAPRSRPDTPPVHQSPAPAPAPAPSSTLTSPLPTVPTDLEAMSEPDLRKLAESNRIDLSKAKGKDAIVRTIRAWTQN